MADVKAPAEAPLVAGLFPLSEFGMNPLASPSFVDLVPSLDVECQHPPSLVLNLDDLTSSFCVM